MIAKFNGAAQKNEDELKSSPYSDKYVIKKFDRNAQDYARPTVGSKTEARANRAGDYVTREIIFLCELISQNAVGEPPNCIIKFGPLFYLYAHYSDKLVGMLLRARKYGLVSFEGEMLYQRQDDHKEIRLLKTIDEIRKIVKYSGDPVNCVAIVQ
uniref:Costars domain-containing protein n=1 Tax=Panagrellus redivivus TaxID=6233 RepID=A0A7E4VHL2_PANRE